MWIQLYLNICGVEHVLYRCHSELKGVSGDIWENKIIYGELVQEYWEVTATPLGGFDKGKGRWYRVKKSLVVCKS